MFSLAFDMTPETGAIFTGVLGLGLFLYWICPQWLKDVIKELWDHYNKPKDTK